MSDVNLSNWLSGKGYSLQWGGGGGGVTATGPNGQQINIPASDFSGTGTGATFNPAVSGGQSIVGVIAAPQNAASILGKSTTQSTPAYESTPTTYESTPATSILPATGTESSLVPLRSAIGRAGGSVNWQGANQPIGVTLNGQTTEIPASDYQLVTQPGSQYATAEVSQNIMDQLVGNPNQLVNNALSSGDPIDPNYWNNVVSSITQQYANFQKQMSTIIQQYGTAGAQALNAYQSQFQNALNTVSAAVANQNAQSSPAVQAAIAILQQQNAVDNKNLEEELAARGLSQSGIMAYEKGQLQQNLTNQENQLLGNWTAQQQQNQYNAALTEAQMEGQYAGNYAQMLQQEQEAPLQMEEQVASEGFNVASQLQQWAASGEASSWNAYQQRMLDEEKMQQSWNEFAANYGLKQQSQQDLNAYREDRNALYQTSIENTELARQASLGLQQLRAQIAANNSTNTANKYNDQNTATAIGQVLQAPDRATALQYIASQGDTWAKQGVDMNQVISAINATYGTVAQNQTPFYIPGSGQ